MPFVSTMSCTSKLACVRVCLCCKKRGNSGSSPCRASLENLHIEPWLSGTWRKRVVKQV